MHGSPTRSVTTWTHPLPTLGAGAAVTEAMAALRDADALLVQEDGRPIGVLTRQDLLGFVGRD